LDDAAAGINHGAFGTLDRCRHLGDLLGPGLALIDVIAGQVHRRVVVGHDLRLLDVVVPVYEELSGWQQPIGDCRNWEDLPAAAQAYLQRVSELAAAPIGIVSVGPAREQTIMV
jgi:adenylosuccinate synthase